MMEACTHHEPDFAFLLVRTLFFEPSQQVGRFSTHRPVPRCPAPCTNVAIIHPSQLDRKCRPSMMFVWRTKMFVASLLVFVMFFFFSEFILHYGGPYVRDYEYMLCS